MTPSAIQDDSRRTRNGIAMPSTPPQYRLVTLLMLCLLSSCTGNLRFDDEQYRPLETPIDPHATERRAWN